MIYDINVENFEIALVIDLNNETALMDRSFIAFLSGRSYNRKHHLEANLYYQDLKDGLIPEAIEAEWEAKIVTQEDPTFGPTYSAISRNQNQVSPLFLSVACFLNAEPSPELIAYIRERSKSFKFKDYTNIEGIRLVKSKFTEKEL